MKLKQWLSTLVLTLLLAGCVSAPQPVPPPPAPSPEPPPAAAESPEDYYRIRTFFATDRNHVPSARPNEAFGAEPDTLRYGVAVVSIPHDHRMGDIERPWIFRKEVPSRHVVLLSADVLDPAAFYTQLSDALATTSGNNALLFVHGYNVSFREAAYRTAQMAYDLEFDGAPVFYSWPSADSAMSYGGDARNIAWSKSNMERFLVDFFRRSTVDNVYVVSHSMGNRAVTDAIIEAARQEPSIRTRLKHLVLAAPDIDADDFRNRIAPGLAAIGAPVTLYASSGDLALRLSQEVHGGFKRAGQSGPDLVVVDGVYTVDASSVDTGFLGHSYYGEERSILSDMFQLFRGAGPDERASIRRRVHPNGPYWEFKP